MCKDARKRKNRQKEKKKKKKRKTFDRQKPFFRIFKLMSKLRVLIYLPARTLLPFSEHGFLPSKFKYHEWDDARKTTLNECNLYTIICPRFCRRWRKIPNKNEKEKKRKWRRKKERKIIKSMEKKKKVS